MIGIVIVTHGKFGEALVASAELIIGKQDNVISLGLEHDGSIETLREQLTQSIAKVDQGKGVLVLVDVFGGSPSNISLSCMKDLEFKSISGVNMPMILEAFSLRDSHSLQELTSKCVEAGERGVKDLYKQLEIAKQKYRKGS